MSKEVMQQALEALERCTKFEQRDYDAMDALKEAIKQAGEIEDSLESAYAAGQVNGELAAFEQAGEPVAWRWKHESGAITKLEPTAKDAVNWEPLYTAAPSIQAAPYEAIGSLLAQVMDQAVANGANSVSMPDEYVEIAAWLSAAPSE